MIVANNTAFVELGGREGGREVYDHPPGPNTLWFSISCVLVCPLVVAFGLPIRCWRYVPNIVVF